MKKNFKRIATSALALSVLATTSTPFINFSASASNDVQSGEQYANNIELELASDDAAAQLNNIVELNGDKASLINKSDDNTVKQIDGKLSNRKVKSESDAKAVLNEIASLLGIEDINNDLVFVDCENGLYNDIYTFKQNYNGVIVENGYVSIVVDNETYNTEYLNNTLASNLSIDTTPDIPAGEAEIIIRKELGIDTNGTPSLVIYGNSDNEYKLAWKIQTNDTEINGVYIDAKNGEIIYKVTSNKVGITYNYKDTKPNPITGLKEFDINMNYCEPNNPYYGETYQMYDTKRNIWLVNDTTIEDNMEIICREKGNIDFLIDNPTYFETNYKNIINDKVIRRELYNDTITNDWVSDGGVVAGHMYQLSRVWDYYYHYNWKGFNGKNNASFIQIDFSGKSLGSYASPYGDFLHFTYDSVRENNIPKYCYEAAALDVVAHEFTHRVSINKLKWAESTQEGSPDGVLNMSEAAALNEAYSDIMGEYVEAEYSDSGMDWMTGAAMYAGLNNPEEYLAGLRDYTELPTYPGTDIPLTYDAEKIKPLNCHKASPIITHVAYLMHEFGIPDHVAQKVWYTSMDYLPKGSNKATFYDCRTAVSRAADKIFDRYQGYPYSQRLDWSYKISTAFNAVHIFSKGELIGDVNVNGKIDEEDVRDLENYLKGTYKFVHHVATYFSDLTFDAKIDDKDVAALKEKIKTLSVIAQPVSASATVGTVIKTEVGAAGTGLKYQWYVKNPGQTVFSKSSITNYKYSYEMTDAKSGREVYCVVSDKYGNTKKTNTVSLGAPVKIVKQPTNASAAIGSTVKTTVSATGNGLTYQWYVCNPGNKTFTKSSIKTSTYSYEMTTAKSGRKVYCVIKDKYGNEVKTNTVTLTSKVTITKQPFNASATIGTGILTTVSATGNGLKYQWYVKNPGSKTFVKSSITSSGYYYIMTEAKAGRKVYCVITDQYGNKVTTNTVELKSDIKIINPPTNASAAIGSTVKTTVTATGKGLKYQWYVRNPGQKGFSISSVKNATYSYTMTDAKSGRQVYCVITDDFGHTVTTNIVTLTKK